MTSLNNITQQIRLDILEMTTVAGSGHPTSSLSAVEIIVGLFFGENGKYFKSDLEDFSSLENDRIIFSKGHASPLFYALYKALGVLNHDQILEFRKFESSLEGHPTPRFEFTEATTGSLGMGLGIGLGIALANRIDNSSAKVFVLLGDSEMAEGSNWEAMQLASYYKMQNIIGIIDINRLGQRGETMEAWDLDTYRAKCLAFGWEVFVCEEGNNLESVIETFEKVYLSNTSKPKMILAKTKKGAGISFLEDKLNWHGKVLNQAQFAAAKSELENKV